ncbi:alpha-2,8-polysialyltransferase family protein [Streptomyces sp. NBC_01142]|uniref:alpha-2,8-polysialyltransferase family protein n=1 Tax=Streptomyces sp. NBC_01142 TaxID=2975865 RepID=UPI00224E0784|nr:alpha-2,8-polysialyltransferase family protein [Streptomyces sp. NBC_01142]MCX4818909.1 alpha-2,8-polysialyltransferase family protein [Streptomyces sp. NBC_01142]
MRTTQIFFAGSLYGATTLAAAIDSGCFTPADRRLLLVSNNATTPETTPALDEMAGFERLRGRFDGVLSWNEAISPFHPGGWAPRGDDAPMWERYLRLLWDLGDDRIELAVESIQVNPALAIAQLFPDATLDVYADGLMSYGPTRNKIDPLVGERVRRLFHLDLVPGLKPLLLEEFGAEPRIVPTEAFVKVVDELSDAVADAVADAVPSVKEGPALLLGQYLAALGILTPEEEEALHLRMLRGAVALGHRRIVFKPHPTAPASWSRALQREAESLDAELTVLDMPLLAEVLYRQLRPALVAGCFSTALFTASTFYGIPVARIGTEPLLDRLTPYQNSNRVPLTIVDALLPDLAEGGAGTPKEADETVTGLLSAVGFAMQPQIRPDLRPAAESYLSRSLHSATLRYFKRRRLTVLGLPGGVPVPRGAAVRRVVRRARRLKRVALG